MQTPRSLPPEFVSRTQQASVPVDPIKILFQEANRAEIDQIGAGEWITLYAFESSRSGTKYYFCAMTPKDHLEKVMAHDSSDLMINHGFPGFTKSFESGETITRYDRFTSAPIEPIVYVRSFHDLKPLQIDISEEFRHFHDLYHDRRNDRYIQMDERGEDVVVVEVTATQVRAKTRYVRQFLGARNLFLLVFFDHRADASVEPAMAKEALANENVVKTDLRYMFHVGELGISKERTTFSRLLGKRLIPPLPIEECGAWPYNRTRKFADYIIGVDAKGQ